MNHDFDTFVKQHLEEILCQAEKEHSLAMIRKLQIHRHNSVKHSLLDHIQPHEVQVQDCAVSPNFSHSHL